MSHKQNDILAEQIHEAKQENKTMTKIAKHCELNHDHEQHCHGKRPCYCGACNEPKTMHTPNSHLRKPGNLHDENNCLDCKQEEIIETLLDACRTAIGMLVDHVSDCPAFDNDEHHNKTCDCGLDTIKNAIAKARVKV